MLEAVDFDDRRNVRSAVRSDVRGDGRRGVSWDAMNEVRVHVGIHVGIGAGVHDVGKPFCLCRSQLASVVFDAEKASPNVKVVDGLENKFPNSIDRYHKYS